MKTAFLNTAFLKTLRVALMAIVIFGGYAAAQEDAAGDGGLANDAASAVQSSAADVIDAIQPKVVKLYGAGGFQGLEAWQSGFLISADGYILTVWSYVLDTDTIIVHLKDGRRVNATLVGADPRLEVAVLKITEKVEGLDHFTLEQSAQADGGTRVLAFSNLYNVATREEPVSVQHGVVSVVTRLEARRGVFQTPYRGMVYVLDAVTNNAGAAGGALTDTRGRLLAMLGKELKNDRSNTWLNYAIPISEVAEVVPKIISGEFIPSEEVVDERPKADDPLKLEMLGIYLVPDVLERTPPFVDSLMPGSPAAQAGMMPDDLILFLNNEILIQSCKALREELEYIDRDEMVKLTVIRDQELLHFDLKAP